MRKIGILLVLALYLYAIDLAAFDGKYSTAAGRMFAEMWRDFRPGG